MPWAGGGWSNATTLTRSYLCSYARPACAAVSFLPNRTLIPPPHPPTLARLVLTERGSTPPGLLTPSVCGHRRCVQARTLWTSRAFAGLQTTVGALLLAPCSRPPAVCQLGCGPVRHAPSHVCSFPLPWGVHFVLPSPCVPSLSTAPCVLMPRIQHWIHQQVTGGRATTIHHIQKRPQSAAKFEIQVSSLPTGATAPLCLCCADTSSTSPLPPLVQAAFLLVPTS